MGIAEKLRIASEKCRYVQKDGLNSFHKYRFASAANILGHVNEALALAGAAVVDTDVTILGETGAGKERVVTAKVSITIRDTQTEETATFRGIGSGQDAGDKAVMKATTAAQKYAWIVGLSIETGEDPEGDDATDRHNEAPRKAPAGKPTQKPDARDLGAMGIESRGVQQEPAWRNALDALAESTPSLSGLCNAIERAALPGDCVTAWTRHREPLTATTPAARESAWTALALRTASLGGMTPDAAKTWLKKSLAPKPAEAQS